MSRGDHALVAAVDTALAAGALRAGAWLACRVGCTECCVGPFPIGPLDALRLQRGLRLLESAAPARAAALRARAVAATAQLRSDFPGDRDSGRLGDDEAAEERFCSAHAGLPCPALDPLTGACELYAARPLACRTFGLPVRLSGADLPPCRLCFAGATPAQVEACRVEPDPLGLEAALLSRLPVGDTVIAFALALAPR